MKHIAVVCVAILLTSCTTAGGSSRTDTPNHAYDAVSLFGIGNASAASLPTAGSGEIVINYGGWSMNQLAQTTVGRKLLRYVDNSARKESWADATFPPGIYRLSATSQALKPAPAVVMATALLAWYTQKGNADLSDKSDPIISMVDHLHCSYNKNPAGLVGLYWSSDGENSLEIDQNYCIVLGGGIWEGSL